MIDSFNRAISAIALGDNSKNEKRGSPADINKFRSEVARELGISDRYEDDRLVWLVDLPGTRYVQL